MGIFSTESFLSIIFLVASVQAFKLWRNDIMKEGGIEKKNNKNGDTCYDVGDVFYIRYFDDIQKICI